ncbi:hypothetical protein Back11_32760 [Paenibacillus baekrokdamisoli]|uniref:Uncharacterized protein n=1 Tax=Paenibacillus baekrokdamisoli TaxID=1712516 RepID=A0A3G9J7W9_9BACL|nr:extracellular solute-binding protein [Paenibacillus baekrokdamisoli]MBB3071557.1 multiple sugar transport system substrate-binding protein [Paenibacillus baekrokdamisoli]BBH21931.1 hypothetical protein Back11_32760 [Paenibacillus baekrokdamisoli]
MKSNDHRSPFRTVAAIMSVIILLGCGWWFRGDLKDMLGPKIDSSIPAALRDDPLADKEVTLKIHQFPQTGSFEYTIRKPFIIRHPSVRITMTNAPNDSNTDASKFISWMEQEKPDLLQLPMNLYVQLAAEGKLKSIDSFIKSSKFDIDSLYAPLVQLLRKAGGGELYGLSSDFTSTALFINEDLFAKYGVPLPKGNITMDEVLVAAARFQGTGVSGLDSYYSRNPYRIVNFIGQSMGLQSISDSGGTMHATVESGAWKEVWQKVAGGYKEGWLAKPKPIVYSKGGSTMKDIYKQDLFAQGKIAMKIDDSYYYRMMNSYESEAGMKLSWSTLPLHMDLSATNQTQYLNTGTVYAINTDTVNSEAAWELLRFITGGELVKSSQLSMSINPLSSRETDMKSQPSNQWKAFYQTNVDPDQVFAEINLYQKNPSNSEVNSQLEQLGSGIMQSVMDGKITVDAAVHQLQEKLEQVLLMVAKQGGTK